jgi:hypothetical protein
LSLLAQRKVTKRKGTPDGAKSPFASRPPGREAQGVFGGSGRAFFGDFLCTSKERNPPAVRGTAITTRPQAAQMKSRPKGGFVMYTLDPRLRGDDAWIPAFAGMTTKNNRAGVTTIS